MPLVFGALKRDRRGGVLASRWRVIPNEIAEVDLLLHSLYISQFPYDGDHCHQCIKNDFRNMTEERLKKSYHQNRDKRGNQTPSPMIILPLPDRDPDGGGQVGSAAFTPRASLE